MRQLARGREVLLCSMGGLNKDLPALLTRVCDTGADFFLGGNSAPAPVFGIVGSPDSPMACLGVS